MVMWIFVAAKAFTTIFVTTGVIDIVGKALVEMPGGRGGVIIAMQVFLFLWGCFLDPGSMTVICIPLMVPIVKNLGFDPIWFGALFVMNIETGFLTPPFGYNIFYLKGVAPKEITMGDIYRSISPFVTLQVMGIVIVMIFPQIALWFPNLIFGAS